MKDQLVTYETAILAKEKGFDVPTMAGYDENGVAWYPAGRNTSSTEPRVYKTQNYYTLAPTQALLARWLREVKKYHTWINVIYDTHCMDIRFQMAYMEEGEKETWTYFGVYNTYEQALEEGLTQALKLL